MPDNSTPQPHTGAFHMPTATMRAEQPTWCLHRMAAGYKEHVAGIREAKACRERGTAGLD